MPGHSISVDSATLSAGENLADGADILFCIQRKEVSLDESFQNFG
jgi:hypothetical protein